MEPNRLDDEIKKLPPTAQKQIFDFIAFIKTRHQKPVANRQSKKKTGLMNEPFIGIWKAREDMKDSSLWVRKMRKAEWIKPDA
jgi:mRNA-degrading endonuclease RelE of RelBE toxin-antitoxin system